MKDLEKNITNSLRDLVDLIKVQCKNNLFEQTQELNLNQKDLEKIVYIAEASINSTFVNQVGRIVERLNNLND